MKTYKLTSEKEIRDMLEATLRISDAKDYCLGLMGFFEQKLEDIIDLFVTRKSHGNDSEVAEKKANKLYKEYGLFDCDAYDLDEAFEDYRTARDHYERFDDIVKRIVKEQLEKPLSVEIDDPEDEDDVRNAHLDLDSNFYGCYSSDIMPVNVCKLYEHSHGISEWFEIELKDFLEHYDLI